MKNYITVEGAEKLKQELKQLLTRDRPALTQVIQWAASNGDRSENGDYIYGKRRLREMDRRIRFLTKRLEAAEVVDLSKVPRDRVVFGAKVTILDEEGSEKTYRIVGQDEIDAKKGDVIGAARLAGIMAAKQTPNLIPLCHPLMLTKVTVDISEDTALPGLRVTATTKLTGRTGVEMEALTAVSVACLTIYDMAKAVDRTMEIGSIRLLEKSGGKSGDFRHPEA